MASHRVGMSQGGEEAQAGTVGSVPAAPQGGEALSLANRRAKPFGKGGSH